MLTGKIKKNDREKGSLGHGFQLYLIYLNGKMLNVRMLRIRSFSPVACLYKGFPWKIINIFSYFRFISSSELNSVMHNLGENLSTEEVST